MGWREDEDARVARGDWAMDDAALDPIAKFERDCADRNAVLSIGLDREQRRVLQEAIPDEERPGLFGPPLNGAEAVLHLRKQRKAFEAEDRALRLRYSCIDGDDE